MSREVGFWQVTRAMALTWGLVGAAWWWDQTSPLGWWTLKPRTREEREMARFYQRTVPPFPGDRDSAGPEAEAHEKGSGGSEERPAPRVPSSLGELSPLESVAPGMENLPARFVRETGRRAQAEHVDPAVAEHQERLEREGQKLWLRMRREAARELLQGQQARQRMQALQQAESLKQLQQAQQTPNL